MSTTGSPPEAFNPMHFLVSIGEPLGFFMECSGLEVEWEVFEYNEGGLNDFVHKLRGRSKYPNLVLRRGFTSETALFDWFRECREKTARRQVDITLRDYQSQPLRTWSFDGAWPVKWTGPSLNAKAGEAATESLEIAHHGLKEG